MSPPPTIIFDLSEVLIAGIIGIERVLGKRLGIPADGILSFFRCPSLDELCRGRLTEADYLDGVLADTGWQLDRLELAALLRANFRREVPGTFAIVRELAPRHELVLHSDHAREWIADIEPAHPLLTLFRHRCYSFVFGGLKREPGTFSRVLAHLGRLPAECLLVDDSAANVIAAVDCGLDAILFTEARALRRELRSRGIAVAVDDELLAAPGK